MSTLSSGTYSQTPTPLPPAPRRVHAGGFLGYWPARLFVMPHVIIGICVPCYSVLLLLAAIFYTPAPAQVTDTRFTTSTKHGTSYYLNYRFTVDGREYNDSTSVPFGLYQKFQNAPVMAAPMPAPAISDTFGKQVTLFNGESVEGWTWVARARADGTEPSREEVWSVHQGILHLNGRKQVQNFAAGYLRKNLPTGNYMLTIESRQVEAGVGGVLIGIKGADRVWPRCITIRDQGGETGEILHGRGFAMTTPAERTEEGKEGTVVRAIGPPSEKPLGEWNVLQVVVDQGMLMVKVNGVAQNVATEVAPLSGVIGLQAAGGEMEFRKIEFLALEGGGAGKFAAPEIVAAPPPPPPPPAAKNQVTARFFQLGPWYHTSLVEGGTDWSTVGFMTFWSVFWDGILSIFVWQYWVRPLRIRGLYRNGAVGTGVVVDKRVVRGKSRTYYLKFIYEDAVGTKTQVEMQIPRREEWDRATAGEAVTVMYDPKRLKRAAVYEYGGYRVEGAGPVAGQASG